MSDHDSDMNGPSEEELRDMLRSLPRQQAPSDFDAELMRRVDGIRRRRGLLSVLHTAARADWKGGLVSAATAAVVVAGSWLLVGSPDEVEHAQTARPAPATEAPATTAPAAASRHRTAATALSLPSAMPGGAPRDLTEPAALTARTPAPRKVAAQSSSRRSSNARRRHAAQPDAATGVVLQALDTITATRIRSHASRSVSPTTEAGVRTARRESTPAPAPILHGEPTGVDTGGGRTR